MVFKIFYRKITAETFTTMLVKNTFEIKKILTNIRPNFVDKKLSSWLQFDKL